jgi:hypothetical protein
VRLAGDRADAEIDAARGGSAFGAPRTYASELLTALRTLAADWDHPRTAAPTRRCRDAP